MIIPSANEGVVPQPDLSAHTAAATTGSAIPPATYEAHRVSSPGNFSRLTSATPTIVFVNQSAICSIGDWSFVAVEARGTSVACWPGCDSGATAPPAPTPPLGAVPPNRVLPSLRKRGIPKRKPEKPPSSKQAALQIMLLAHCRGPADVQNEITTKPLVINMTMFMISAAGTTLSSSLE
jgi:hypothetical protein